MKKYTLIGVDGNAYCVMSYVRQCMLEVGMSESKIKEYINEATKGDYNNLLCVSADMIEKCNQLSDN